jgi:hypothetical protein
LTRSFDILPANETPTPHSASLISRRRVIPSVLCSLRSIHRRFHPRSEKVRPGQVPAHVNLNSACGRFFLRACILLTHCQKPTRRARRSGSCSIAYRSPSDNKSIEGFRTPRFNRQPFPKRDCRWWRNRFHLPVPPVWMLRSVHSHAKNPDNSDSSPMVS